MIKIEELRIGNYILADNVIKKVCCIKKDNIASQQQYVGFEDGDQCRYEACDSERLQFMPLTDHVLQDSGFTFHTYFRVWQHSRPSRSYSIELDSDFAALDFVHRVIVKNLEFVHTLQNLFYCIQGIELNLEMKKIYNLPDSNSANTMSKLLS